MTEKQGFDYKWLIGIVLVPIVGYLVTVIIKDEHDSRVQTFSI